MKIRKKFRDIFKEDDKETLTLLHNLDVKGQKFDKGQSFDLDEDIAGINFHKYRYLDLAVEVESEEGIETEEEYFKIVGFYPSK